MHRKDYEAIAAALAAVKARYAPEFSPITKVLLHAHTDCARAVAQVCAEDNVRFRTNQFLAACGVDQPAGKP